jgi:hypothetical protein
MKMQFGKKSGMLEEKIGENGGKFGINTSCSSEMLNSRIVLSRGLLLD